MPSHEKKKSTTQIPPPPPPPPAGPRSPLSSLTSRIRTALPERFFLSAQEKPRDPAPEGVYFFYGTLLDPGMLVEILGLDNSPELRPAFIEGFDCKLWGQYPALTPCSDASGRGVIKVAAYRVDSSEDAEKLAEYETHHYMPCPCEIKYIDDIQTPIAEKGFGFVFVGNKMDLKDGIFNLRAWRKLMGKK